MNRDKAVWDLHRRDPNPIAGPVGLREIKTWLRQGLTNGRITRENLLDPGPTTGYLARREERDMRPPPWILDMTYSNHDSVMNLKKRDTFTKTYIKGALNSAKPKKRRKNFPSWQGRQESYDIQREAWTAPTESNIDTGAVQPCASSLGAVGDVMFSGPDGTVTKHPHTSCSAPRTIKVREVRVDYRHLHLGEPEKRHPWEHSDAVGGDGLVRMTKDHMSKFKADSRPAHLSDQPMRPKTPSKFENDGVPEALLVSLPVHCSQSKHKSQNYKAANNIANYGCRNLST